MSLYTSLIRPIAFRLDAERAHHLAIGAAARMGWAAPALRGLFAVEDPRLATTVAGLRFPNPVGLAAGFDKSGTAVAALAGLGFGSVEIGSVSLDASAGNPKPRLFRLPADRAIVVHYGLPNDGARAVAARLKGLRLPVPLGINLVKTNHGGINLGACPDRQTGAQPGSSPGQAFAGTCAAPPETDAQIIGEYVKAAHLLSPFADYLMLNLSCPNTEDGRDFFAERAHLDACLDALAALNLRVPVFLKVSPLGGIAAIERLLAAAEPHRFVSGFMFNLSPLKPENLTTPAAVWRAMPGAVSGRPATALADLCIRETFRRMDRKRFCVIGAGGVFTAEDAYGKIRLGAALVQLLTALIYEGPGVVRRITSGLAQLLERDGFANVADAVGVDSR